MGNFTPHRDLPNFPSVGIGSAKARQGFFPVNVEWTVAIIVASLQLLTFAAMPVGVMKTPPRNTGSSEVRYLTYPA
jgi:hypothetical protein